MPPLTIRAATPADIPVILRFVRALAVYENAEHEVLATPDHVQRTLFCDQPKVFGLICEQGDTPLGFAVYFFNYSTWQGRHGLYLEDLYVAPEHRGQGAGMALLQNEDYNFVFGKTLVQGRPAVVLTRAEKTRAVIASALMVMLVLPVAPWLSVTFRVAV